MIFFITNLFVMIGFVIIILYTRKIHSLEEDGKQQVLQVLRKYPELYFAFKHSRSKHSLVNIPGMLKTQSIKMESKEIEDCYHMTPQGVGVNKNHIFISAYCHSRKHQSVIYMLDKISGKYIKTIILKNRTHAGGLVYDQINNCLWVSAASKEHGHGRVAAIPMNNLYDYPLNRRYVRSIEYSMILDFPGIAQASFITIENEHLYAGSFNLTKNGAVTNASLDERGERNIDSNEIHTVTLPPKIQGIAFYKDYCLLSESYGPVSSKIMVFSNDQFYNGVLNEKQAIKIIKAPPYLEQLTVYGNHLYAVFESSAASYRDKTTRFIPYVITFYLPTMFRQIKISE